MESFQQALEDCQLSDLGYKGSRFTWNNGKEDENFTKERLDRAMANQEWCSMFGEYEVRILAARSSDHKPLLVRFGTFSKVRQRKRRGFRFEASWTVENDFQEIVQEAWGEGNGVTQGLESMRSRLDRCQHVLERWDREKLRHGDLSIKNLTTRLELLQRQETPVENCLELIKS
ncbi:uncharacterized protein LOC132177967 [Corylus avellana]|uniref:uncharacterized protein LOC132177967 n=1 Tax=Corylus avellana TaxID=13451 RepID=UPI00286C325B|nr:uncharacterized protein LOC132177967 [Corylus avellana]